MRENMDAVAVSPENNLVEGTTEVIELVALYDAIQALKDTQEYSWCFRLRCLQMVCGVSLLMSNVPSSVDWELYNSSPSRVTVTRLPG